MGWEFSRGWKLLIFGSINFFDIWDFLVGFSYFDLIVGNVDCIIDLEMGVLVGGGSRSISGI